jgi:hypothetical protein
MVNEWGMDRARATNRAEPSAGCQQDQAMVMKKWTTARDFLSLRVLQLIFKASVAETRRESQQGVHHLARMPPF